MNKFFLTLLILGSFGAISFASVCGIINTPGTTTLDSNVSSATTCFNIQSNDVILDCAGFAMDGLSGSGYGILIDTEDNVSVLNCNIHDFATDVRLITSTNILINDSNISNSSNLIYSTGGTGINISYVNGIGASGASIRNDGSGQSRVEYSNLDGGTYGIQFENVNDGYIGYNRILGSSLNGISQSNGNATRTEFNVVDVNGADAAYHLNTETFTVFDNNVDTTPVSTYGLLLEGLSNNTSITNNNLFGLIYDYRLNILPSICPSIFFNNNQGSGGSWIYNNLDNAVIENQSVSGAIFCGGNNVSVNNITILPTDHVNSFVVLGGSNSTYNNIYVNRSYNGVEVSDSTYLQMNNITVTDGVRGFTNNNAQLTLDTAYINGVNLGYIFKGDTNANNIIALANTVGIEASSPATYVNVFNSRIAGSTNQFLASLNTGVSYNDIAFDNVTFTDVFGNSLISVFSIRQFVGDSFTINKVIDALPYPSAMQGLNNSLYYNVTSGLPSVGIGGYLFGSLGLSPGQQSRLQLFDYNGSDYIDTGATPNLLGQRITTSTWTSNSTLSLLLNTTPYPCPLINASGVWNLGGYNLTGAPYSTHDTYYACVEVNASNVVIDCQGNTVDNSLTGVPFAYGIDIPAGFNNVTIQNCNVNAYTDGIYDGGSNDYISFNNINNSVFSGIYGYNFSNNTYKQNSFSGFYDTAFGAIYVSYSDNLTIDNNTFSNGQTGIYLISANNLNILRNTFNTLGYLILHLQASINTTITDNVAIGSSSPMLIQTTNNALIANNSFIGAANGATIEDSSLIVFTENNITNGNSNVFLTNSTYSTISNNRLLDANTWGILVQSSSYSNITGNYIYNSSYGVWFNTGDNDIIVSNNTIDIMSSYGVATSNAVNMTISNNNISNSNEGIYISPLISTYNNINGNTLFNMTLNGIAVLASNNIVDNNSLETIGLIAIQSTGSDNTISNNVINNTGNGIIVQTSPAQVINNTISNGYISLVDGTSGSYIANNTITFSASSAIFITGSNSVLETNTIHDSNSGIFTLSGSNITVRGGEYYNLATYAFDIGTNILIQDSGGVMAKVWNASTKFTGLSDIEVNFILQNEYQNVTNYIYIQDHILANNGYTISAVNLPYPFPLNLGTLGYKVVQLGQVPVSDTITIFALGWNSSDFAAETNYSMRQYAGSWGLMPTTQHNESGSGVNYLVSSNVVPSYPYALAQTVQSNYSTSLVDFSYSTYTNYTNYTTLGNTITTDDTGNFIVIYFTSDSGSGLVGGLIAVFAALSMAIIGKYILENFA